MALNFYLELAAFIIGIILCMVSFSQYKITDLKGRVYVQMLRVVTIMTGCNFLSYLVIDNNLSTLMGLAEVIICFSFLLMVWIWMYMNLYLIETIQGKNYYTNTIYIIVGLPFFAQMIITLFNCSNHNLFDVSVLNNDIHVIFNTWYVAPYILAAISLGVYLGILVKFRKVFIEKKRYVFFLVPILMLLFYYLQYRFASVAIVGFGYMIVLLLLYLYSFQRSIKRDSLTRLPDGSSFKRMLDYRIGQKQTMTVAMITLDDFKQVNREYGYQNGNRYLQLIATYIKDKAPQHCVARYSGDKFAVVFDEQACDTVQTWCDELLTRFESVWEIGKLQHKLSACISLVEYPAMASTSEQIFDLLEHMNTYGKQNKRNQCIVCNDEFKKSMERRLRIAAMLSDVVQERKMHVEYQPILEVQANAFTRAEALFRLEDVELGNIPPNEFFPIAEENGYIIDVGYILLEQVCQYMQSFKEQGQTVPVVSVNFFRQQIMDENVDEKVRDILDKYQITPSDIAFELPESIFSLQYNKVKEQVMKLHQVGCRFYLDGFGNAISDLSKLMELPFEVIKFNKTILKDAEKDDAIYLLVSAMTAVLEENDKMILGDGIGSEHMKEMADLLFMDYLQGHYLCEPQSGDDAKAVFARTDVFEQPTMVDELLAEMELD